jgi:8-oxo-dGTP diphosphatase
MGRRQIRVVGAMLQNDEGRYLITQRPPKAQRLAKS